MDDKQKDISQIRKYLNGELDARAMHQLEREAQDDPFLMDALDGFEKSSAADVFNFDDLDQRLTDRIGESKVRKMFPWKYYAAAASVLLFFSIGYLMWPKPEVAKQQVADLVQPPVAQPDHTAAPTDTFIKPQPVQQVAVAKAPAAPHVKRTPVAAFKQDTPKYVANQSAKLDIDSIPRAAELLAKQNVSKGNSNGFFSKKNPQANARVFGKAQSNIGSMQLPDSAKRLSELVDKTTGGQPQADYAYGKANQPVRGFINRKPDSTTLKEIVIPGVAKLDPNALAAKTAAQPLALDSKVKDAEVKTPKKGNNAMLSQAGLPLNPNLRTPTKNESQTDADGRLTLPTNGQAAADVKARKYVGSRSASNKTDEAAKPESNTGAAGYNKTKPDNIKEAHPKMGWDAYNKYIKAKATGSSGTVRLSFTVDAKGQLGDFRILKSVDEATDKKAIDLVKNGPAWAADVSGKAKTLELKVVFSKE